MISLHNLVLILLLLYCLFLESPVRSFTLVRNIDLTRNKNQSSLKSRGIIHHAFKDQTRIALKSSAANNDQSSVGFIGCGTIASAIITGIATQNVVPIKSIVVSRRSESKSKLLAKEFSNLVTIQDDNQEILKKCEYIFLCVLPEQTQSVLENLQFDQKRHFLVSLVVRSKLQKVLTSCVMIIINIATK
jgi:hypothetical protein